MLKIKHLLLLIFTGILLSSCASSGNQTLSKLTEQSAKDKIIRGKTTKAEIKSMFGSPLDSSFTNNGLETWKYEYSETSVDAVNFIPIVNNFTNSTSGVKKQLTILFNNDGIVKNYIMSESQIQHKSGLF